MRVLAHIKKLDDCFGQFLVRVSCKCGAVREITPEALASLVGWSMTLEQVHGISTFVVWFAATVIPVLIGLNFTTAASA